MDPSRRRLLIKGGIGAAAFVGAIGVGGILLSDSGRKLAPDQYIIPGQGTFDVLNRSFVNEGFYRRRMVASPFDIPYASMNFDADNQYTHIKWQHWIKEGGPRSIEPKNGTELTTLVETDINAVTSDDLTSPNVRFSTKGIDASDDPRNPGTSVLPIGTLIALQIPLYAQKLQSSQTPEIAYAVVRVDEYVTMFTPKSKRVPFSSRRLPYVGYIERPNYNLLVTVRNL